MLSSRFVVARAATDESEALLGLHVKEGPTLATADIDVGAPRGSLCRPSVHSIEEKHAMSIDHVLAVVPVADFEAAHAWYELLFGRPADNLPMEGRLVEWRVTDSGWVQVTRDADRAGSALLNFAVDDLDRHVADISGRGLAPGAIETVNKGVQLSAIPDPDGNTITFIGNFRVHY
jgi:predicted enzyme related to lactoylglutathione lyase